MVSTFNTLPLEVKLLVFDNLINSSYTNLELEEYTMVSKTWTSFFQPHIYASVKFLNSSQFSRYFDAVENNHYLGSLTLDVAIIFSIDCKNVQQISAISKLLTHLTKLKSIDCISATFHKLLANALSKGHLPRLENIKPPFEFDDMNGYIKCAMIIKNRLYNLKITEFHNNDIYGKTLFNNLHHFKSLKFLQMEKTNDDIINLMEKIIRVQPSLEKLVLNVNPSDDNYVRVIDVSGKLKPTFTPLNDVRSLHFTQNILHISQLALYVIHKFPQVRSLHILGQPKRTSRLNEYVLNKFLLYLSNMTVMDIRCIPFKEETIPDSIEPLWKNVSQSHPVNVDINYDNRFEVLDELTIELNQGPATFKFSFASSETDSKHINIIKRYGQNIKNLTFSRVGMWQTLDTTTYNTLFLQPLQHCINLKKLTIQSSAVTASRMCNGGSIIKRSFDSLRILGCIFEKDEFFVNLSSMFTSIRYLEFSDLEDEHNYHTRGIPIIHINMSETEVGTLLVSMNFLLNKHIILLKLMIEDTCTYYKYCLDAWLKAPYKVIISEKRVL